MNIISEFNVENITEFGGDEEMDVSSNETEETDTEEVDKVKIDFNFYKKFWSLQDYFRNPVQCYNKVSWKMFTSVSMGYKKKNSRNLREWKICEQQEVLA